MKRLINFVTSPQGPALRRSGSSLRAPVIDNARRSALVQFTFNEDQAYQIEFGHNKVRFHTNDGLLAYAPITVNSHNNTAFLVLNAAGLNAAVNDTVLLTNFAYDTALNNVYAKVTAVAGNFYTFDVPVPANFNLSGPAQLYRIYEINSPYTETDCTKLRYVQSLNTVYLFIEGKPIAKIERFSNYDWRISDLALVDGPYIKTNDKNNRATVAGTASAVPVMTSNVLPSGTVFGTEGVASFEMWRAFDGVEETHWQAPTDQKGIIGYQFTAPTIVNGYIIYIPVSSTDINYGPLDYAPSTWTFQASNDGVTYVTLQDVAEYVVYDGKRSLYFNTNNTTAYTYYRLNITACRRNGAVRPRIRNLVFTVASVAPVNIKFASVTNINGDQGFDARDVGRLIRIKGKDNVWRPFKISSIVSTTEINATAEGEPLIDPVQTIDWRLGYFSNRTGFPTCGVFFDDRLWVGGVAEYPDTVFGSTTGAYDNFQQTEPSGAVLDTNAQVYPLNARRMSRICWMATDERGLLVGTGSGEWVISAATSSEALTARSVKARNSTARGCANIEPVKIDRQILYIQRAKKSLREFSYVYEADGYKSPSLSLFASHLGVSNFEEVVYSAEPHTIAYIRRANGTIVGFTYNKEENVSGWHEHDFGGAIESISVGPDKASAQDLLWFSIVRKINGVNRRYIERQEPFWTFSDTIDTARFADSCLSYSGPAIKTILGLGHLENEIVVGVADGNVVGPIQVVNGRIVIDYEASNIVLGKAFTSIGETSRIEAGAQDGTAQGKTKRINKVTLRLWASGGGGIGHVNEDTKEDEIDSLLHRYTEVGAGTPTALFSGDVGPDEPTSGYDMDASIVFKTSDPLPFNVICIMPQLNTQDR
jgi:hypothetical protein